MKFKIGLLTLILMSGLIGSLLSSTRVQASTTVASTEMATNSADSSRFASLVGRRRLWKEWRVN